MPAYQWVITKTLNAEVSQPVSPVKIVNREFPNAKDWDNVQFLSLIHISEPTRP